MITLKWSRFPESDIKSYKVYRSMIGFSFPIIGAAGGTMALKLNGGSLQTVTIPMTDLVNGLNQTLLNATAYTSADGLNIIIRSNVRQAPGSIQIGANTIGLTQRLITEKSEAVMIGTVVAAVNENTLEQFVDQDGTLNDFYAISSVNAADIESLKSPWRLPIHASGPVCVIEGVIADLQGVRIADAEVTITLHEAPKNRSLTYITKEPICTLSGPDGRFSIPVLQCALVKLDIPAIGYSQMVTIPEKSYIFLQELLVDENYTYPLGFR